MKSSIWKIFVGIALFVITLILPGVKELSPEGQKMAAVAVLMAFWWVTEAIPISVTALLPLVLFPALGIADARTVSAPYANHLIFLFLGGFLIAMAIQRWNLHRRIALRTVWLVGFSQGKLLLGFMIATAFLSMWISNTATTMIMVPIGIAVVNQLAEQPHSEKGSGQTFGTALMLGTAYSASIGGIGTLIGTPPNIVLANVLENMYGLKIDFGMWLMIGLPLVVVFLPLTWLYLSKIAFRLERGAVKGGREIIRRELSDLGPMTVEEKRVLAVFSLTVFLWIFSAPKEIGSLTIPGVQTIFPGATDSTIAMFGALLLFLIPAQKGRGRLLTWKQARDIPWGILILFGGGLALAEGFKITGLAGWIGSRVEFFAGAPHLILVLAVITLIIFLTELTSNTATTAMILPILAGVAAGIGENPLMMMVPAAIAASCAFMLPVATPPNAIVFGSGYVTIPVMAKKGLAMNLLGIALISALTYLVVAPFIGGLACDLMK